MAIKQIILLNRSGEIIDIFKKGAPRAPSSKDTFPCIVDYYFWSHTKQLKSAEQYKDQIKRVFYQDKIKKKKTRVMLKDDVQRLEVVKSFNYGRKVLEVGCSDGSVCIKIAAHKRVKQVLGIDIRKSAINDGRRLVNDLLHSGRLSGKDAVKIKLENLSIQDLPKKYGKFDSVCAYEVFEHMAPQDILPAFQYLLSFLKKNGNFFISVPNRLPHSKFDKSGRTRWRWSDHRAFFTQISLEIFLKSFFKSVKFYKLYPEDKISDGIYLICECKDKII